jgi:hypothetical protein
MPALKIPEAEILLNAWPIDAAIGFQRELRERLIEAGFDLSRPIDRVDDVKERCLFFYQ